MAFRTKKDSQYFECQRAHRGKMCPSPGAISFASACSTDRCAQTTLCYNSPTKFSSAFIP